MGIFDGASSSGDAGVSGSGGWGSDGMWESIFSGLGSMFAGQSSNRMSKEDRRHQLAMQQAGFLQQNSMLNFARENQLADRQYNAESVGNYAQFNTNPNIVSPGPVSTSFNRLQTTPPPDPKKPGKKSLMIGGR